MTAAGYIAADRAKRPHQLACSEALNWRYIPRSRTLAQREGANLFGRHRQRFAQRGIDYLPCSSHLLPRNAQCTNTRKAVESDRITQQSMVAISAHIGDDALQKMEQGRVMPETFTHGTSEQRVSWFKRGYANGRVEDCDTFNADPL